MLAASCNAVARLGNWIGPVALDSIHSGNQARPGETKLMAHLPMAMVPEPDDVLVVCFGMGTDLLNTWDLKTGELRPSCLQDVIDSAIVGDFCQEIDFIASFALPFDSKTMLSLLPLLKKLKLTYENI